MIIGKCFPYCKGTMRLKCERGIILSPLQCHKQLYLVLMLLFYRWWFKSLLFFSYGVVKTDPLGCDYLLVLDSKVLDLLDAFHVLWLLVLVLANIKNNCTLLKCPQKVVDSNPDGFAYSTARGALMSWTWDHLITLSFNGYSRSNAAEVSVKSRSSTTWYPIPYISALSSVGACFVRSLLYNERSRNNVRACLWQSFIRCLHDSVEYWSPCFHH